MKFEPNESSKIDVEPVQKPAQNTDFCWSNKTKHFAFAQRQNAYSNPMVYALSYSNQSQLIAKHFSKVSQRGEKPATLSSVRNHSSRACSPSSRLKIIINSRFSFSITLLFHVHTN